LFLGGFGVDFSQDDDNIEVGLEVVAKGILAYGTTSFCPTLVTSSPEFYNKVMYTFDHPVMHRISINFSIVFGAGDWQDKENSR